MSEIYFSLDVEANGPIPAVNSMLSLGLAAYALDGPLKLNGVPSSIGVNVELLEGSQPDEETMKWWSDHQEAYDGTRVNAMSPAAAMAYSDRWVHDVLKAQGLVTGQRPRAVCTAYPATYDFMWWHWYSIKFLGRDIFGFQALDMKTAASLILNLPFKEASKSRFPEFWLPGGAGEHTHVGVEDAVEQARMHVAMMSTMRDQRRQHSETLSSLAQFRRLVDFQDTSNTSVASPTTHLCVADYVEPGPNTATWRQTACGLLLGDFNNFHRWVKDVSQLDASTCDHCASAERKHREREGWR